jgi:hypothetical protein
MGGGGGRRGGGGGDMGAMQAPAAPSFKVLVRWFSAQVFRDGLKQQLPAELKGKYVVTVQGLPMMMLSGAGPGGPRPGGGEGQPPQPPSPEEIEKRRAALLERMKQSSHLERKDKDPIGAERVALASGGERPTVVFIFPGDAQPIQAEDKEVVFLSKLGRMEIKAKFPLKDMRYKGELAL